MWHWPLYLAFDHSHLCDNIKFWLDRDAKGHLKRWQFLVKGQCHGHLTWRWSWPWPLNDLYKIQGQSQSQRSPQGQMSRSQWHYITRSLYYSTDILLSKIGTDASILDFGFWSFMYEVLASYVSSNLKGFSNFFKLLQCQVNLCMNSYLFFQGYDTDLQVTMSAHVTLHMAELRSLLEVSGAQYVMHTLTRLRLLYSADLLDILMERYVCLWHNNNNVNFFLFKYMSFLVYWFYLESRHTSSCT